MTCTEKTRILNIIESLGDVTAYDLLERDPSLKLGTRTLRAALSRWAKKGYLEFLRYVHSPGSKSAFRAQYRRTNKPTPVSLSQMSDNEKQLRQERDDTAVRAAKKSKENYRPSVEGARLVRLLDTRHNAHDGIRANTCRAGQSTLSAGVW